MPKPKPKKVSDSDLKSLLRYVPLVGATQVFESDFPGAFESIGVSPRDPAVFGVTTLILAVVALAACWLPARRAAHLSPLDALRVE